MRIFHQCKKLDSPRPSSRLSPTTPAIHGTGYIFLRDALDFTTKQQKKVKGVSVRHVSGPELLDGVRQYALKEFGPMVMTVFDNWGIHSAKDVGHMVFNLIAAGVLKN